MVIVMLTAVGVGLLVLTVVAGSAMAVLNAKARRELAEITEMVAEFNRRHR